jgi:hypothetical protein
MGGCLPEDTLLALQFSADGQFLAMVSEKQGLVVADPAGMEMRQLAESPIDAAGLSWTTDSLRVVYAGAYGASLDIYASALDGQTKRLSASPSRETNPMVHGSNVLYLSTASGASELTTRSLTEDNTGTTLHLPETGRHLVGAVLSPDNRYVAVFGFEHLRPQIYIIDTIAGTVDQITSETDVFALVIGSLAWAPDSQAVGFLRNALIESVTNDNDDWVPFSGSRVAAGTSFHRRDLSNPDAEQTLVRMPDGIRSACYDAQGNVIFSNGSRLMLLPASGGPTRVLSLDLPAALPAPGGDDGEIAFVAANQLIGLTTSTLERARMLTFDLEDKFLLAEEYFRFGSKSKSYDLYEELRASVQRTRDPEMARFIYIANLRRLGRTDKAVAEIEKLLAEGATPGGVPEKYLWRLLGFSYLLELSDLAKAADSLEQYRVLIEGEENDGRDSALNALEIIRETSAPVVNLYAQAVKARLDGDFVKTDQLFGELLTSAPAVLAIHREYINALDGFDTQVYYFSPSQRPFRPSRSQRADYLERLVQLAPDSPLVRNARLDLFLLRIEMGSYSRARALLIEALDSEPGQERPDGILEVFHNYLETPEPQPWINQAMPEVFLHENLRPRLEGLTSMPQDRLLLLVAATKLAILQNQPDKARCEADAALSEWNKIPPSEHTGDIVGLYGRLLVLRAREAEQRGLYSEAAEAYDNAAKLLAEKQVDNFEMQEEIRYRAALLRMLPAQYPDLAARMREIELRTGTELINPNWEPEALKGAVREYVEVYDSTSSTLRQWAAYETGVLLGKLHRTYNARAALVQAASESAPEFLQRKAMLELAALDEYENDPWNAARWYSRMASFPGTAADVRKWCSYQIARLHLSINYNVAAAREALAVIVSNRADTPLSIQAQELLMSTSTR